MKNILQSIVIASVALTTTVQAEEIKPKKPNIIFILADDLGIGNVGCYGADNFKTPNIDALAKSGIRFDHCYASPLCGPTRALLMTGRYAYHTGMTSNQTGSLLNPAKEIMMPRVLKSAGYVTAQCGKWSQLPLEPGDWGFDEYLRFTGSGKYWNTQKDNKTYTVNGKEVPLSDGEYLPDKMQKFVFEFITRHKDEPFYVYYPMSHVHAQILPTPDSAPNSQDLYKDNIVYMDKLVGKLMAELDRLKLRETTLVAFASDNGTAKPYYERSTVQGKALSGHKATMLECGALVPCIASWQGVIKPGQEVKSLINICDFYPTLAEIAGAEPPKGVTIDGKGFSQQLVGKSNLWPRDWIFVELGRRWYDRDTAWKLNESKELFDMRNAPFEETLVPDNTQDETAIAARKRLQAVLDQLNPAGGIMDPGIDKARRQKKKARKASERETATSGNANEKDE